MSPEAFEKCRQAGGKIRTLKMPGGKYMRICILRGKSVKGEMHKQKES